MERVILQFMCVGSLAGVTYLRYTVLTSPNKGETAVHCCDPPLSVLVMLVSRNVFHVVSALQSIVFKRALDDKAMHRTSSAELVRVVAHSSIRTVSFAFHLKSTKQ